MKNQIKDSRRSLETKEDEIVNYQSDLSEERRKKQVNNSDTNQAKITINSCELKKKTSKKKIRKSSEINDKNSPKESIIINKLENLQEKLNLYENEIRSLIEEKVQMQLEMNNLRVNSVKSIKKSTNKNNDEKILTKSCDSVQEIQVKYIEEATGLKTELGTLNSIIDKQRQIVELDFSILNESIVNKNLENFPENTSKFT